MAEAHSTYINQRAPAVGVHVVVKPNYKFFRRLAGLSGSDLVKEAK